MQEWARGSKCFFSYLLDQTDITTENPILSKCVCGSGNRLVSNYDGVQGQPHLLVRSHQQGRPHLLVWSHQQGQPHLLVRPHVLGVAL
jgi:hypothetical protein